MPASKETPKIFSEITLLLSGEQCAPWASFSQTFLQKKLFDVVYVYNVITGNWYLSYCIFVNILLVFKGKLVHLCSFSL